VLVLGGVLTAVDILPAGWRGPVLLVVVVGIVLLCIFAIAGWIGGSGGSHQIARSDGDSSAAMNEDSSVSGSRQDARTKGRNSPAVNVRK